uniref:Temptin Cys/Cys disulfide domain-containing protein n=1 Tax=Globisporangium ultimum (strain ATCC 200006 / CBS 805.95 / DAOM BR144) TaxID=431595 RepID=K3W8A8_GLOUD
MKVVILAMACGMLFGGESHAFPQFVARVPNADKVPGVQAIGHQNAAGGGRLGVFGEAFRVANAQWTTSLCHADSDGDGATNGEELGDPCCRWSADSNQPVVAASQQVSHPGIRNTWTQQQLAAMKCKEAFDPEATADAAGAAAVAVDTTPTPALASPTAPLNSTTSSASADTEMPSTIDPAGLKETPSPLVPKAPRPSP